MVVFISWHQLGLDQNLVVQQLLSFPKCKKATVQTDQKLYVWVPRRQLWIQCHSPISKLVFNFPWQVYVLISWCIPKRLQRPFLLCAQFSWHSSRSALITRLIPLMFPRWAIHHQAQDSFPSANTLNDFVSGPVLGTRDAAGKYTEKALLLLRCIT